MEANWAAQIYIDNDSSCLSSLLSGAECEAIKG